MEKIIEEKKKRAFVVLATGKYQTFIADYILFSQTAYPDTTTIVLHTEKIESKINDSLEVLKNNNFKFVCQKIDLNEIFKLRKNSFLMKSSRFKRTIRWIVYLPIFNEFDEIYIGDIDLLIFKEPSNLFEEHYKHSKFLGLPYSDIVRKQHFFPKPNRLKGLLFVLKFGYKGYLNYIYYKPYVMRKMTGLRYINVKPYFDSVNKNLEKLINELNSDFYQHNKETNRYNICSFSNEEFLYNLMKTSFKKMPKETSGNINNCKNPFSYDFRPHHGIHLGIFRVKVKNKLDYLDYPNYYEQYKQICETKIYKELYKSRSKFYKKIIFNLNNYFKNVQ